MNLEELVAARRGRRSLRELAEDSGMSKATWQTYAVRRPAAGARVPSRSTIDALARGLDVDVEIVWRAIGVSMHLIDDLPDRPALLDALPPRDVLARLTPAQITTAVQMIRLLADMADAPAEAPAAAEPRLGGSRATPRPRVSLASAGA